MISSQKTEMVISNIRTQLYVCIPWQPQRLWSERGHCHQRPLKCDEVKVTQPLIIAGPHFGLMPRNTARASLRTSPSSRVAVFYRLTKPTWARTLFSPPSRGWCLEKRRNNMNRMNVRHCCSNSGKIRWKEQWGWLVFVCVFACSPSLHCVVWIMIWPGSDSIGDVHLYLTLVVSRSCH